MAAALIIFGILLIWYGVKASRKNPVNPNWAGAVVRALLWPLSIFIKER